MPSVRPTKKRIWKKDINHLGIDVEKRKCRTALKDDKGKVLVEFFFGNDGDGIRNLLSRIQINGTHSTTQAILESTGNMWIRIHDTLEENGIDMILANPYKTKIISHFIYVHKPSLANSFPY